MTTFRGGKSRSEGGEEEEELEEGEEGEGGRGTGRGRGRGQFRRYRPRYVRRGGAARTSGEEGATCLLYLQSVSRHWTPEML